MTLTDAEDEFLVEACCGPWCNDHRNAHDRIAAQVRPIVEATLAARTSAAVKQAQADALAPVRALADEWEQPGRPLWCGMAAHDLRAALDADQ